MVDQSAENGLPADPMRRGWQRDDVRAVIGGSQAHVVPLVAATSVVVLDVLRQDRAQMPFADDEHPVSALSADV